MYVHFNMDTAEFIEQLRYGAIKSGARPQLVAAIDDLLALCALDDDLADMEKERDTERENKDDLWLEMRDLLQAIADNDGKAGSNALNSAVDCLSRHLADATDDRQIEALREELFK